MPIDAPEHSDLHMARLRRFSQAASAAGSLRSGMHISSHALLAEIDIKIAYCAGAWLSVIVMACAAAEAQSRQVVKQDYSSKARDLFSDDPDLQWLRSIRNELVHAAEPGTPSQLWKVGGGNLGTNHAALESEATRSVEIMFRAIYGRKSRSKPREA